jgi:hypothetical protein
MPGTPAALIRPNPSSLATATSPGSTLQRKSAQACVRGAVLAVVAAMTALAGLAATTAVHAADAPVTPATQAAASAATDEAPAAFITFVLETTSNCLLTNGQQIQMRSSHPSRKIRVWLDRFQRGIGTGDRSRTDLTPGAEPDPLGCSRSAAGVQEWRVVKAQFVD